MVYDVHMATDTTITETDGRIDWPDGTAFTHERGNPCCGTGYPLALLPDGTNHCGGCGDRLSGMRTTARCWCRKAATGSCGCCCPEHD